MRPHLPPPTGPYPSSFADGPSLPATAADPRQVPILAAAPAVPVADQALGSPGGSAMSEYRKCRDVELARWQRSLPWRAAAVFAAALAAAVLAGLAGLDPVWPVMLAAAAVCAWGLRFRPSPPTRAWRHGARGQRATARRLHKLGGDGTTILHDVQVPGSRASIDHLVIGAAGVFVIDSRRWRGHVRRDADGTLWHGQSPIAPTLDTVSWEAEQVRTCLDVPPEIPVLPVVAIHRARVIWGPHLHEGVAVTAATGLASLLRGDTRLTAEEVARLADRAGSRLHPAA